MNVAPADVQNDVPEDEEIREAVKALSNGRAGGASRVRSEDIKYWLAGAKIEEKDARSNGVDPGDTRGDKWRAFVQLVQGIWESGEIPRQMRWLIVVLIPKGGGDYRGIGLMEPMWKTIEIIMVTRMRAIEFHDCLHGSVPKRGTGTAKNRGEAGPAARLPRAGTLLRGIPRLEESV